jgi:hypothetical protein
MPLLAFCCTHVAHGADVWQLTRNEPCADLPDHIDATCRICTGLPESSFTADDVVVLHAVHLEAQLDHLLA